MSDEAANTKWAGGMLLATAILSVPVWMVLIVLGGHLHQPEILALGIVILVVAATVEVAGQIKWSQANRIASNAVGFRFKGFPPRTATAYERWCELHQLVPYNANEVRR